MNKTKVGNKKKVDNSESKYICRRVDRWTFLHQKIRTRAKENINKKNGVDQGIKMCNGQLI